MTASDKLLDWMRANPRDWRLEDVEALCRAEGIACTPPRAGSHFKVKHADVAEILTIPARRPIKPVHPRAGAVRRRRPGDAQVKPEDYEIDIRPLPPEEGGGFVAVAPELPGCRSDGDTPEEALRNGYDAVACWIEAAIEMGRAVPEPRRAAA